MSAPAKPDMSGVDPGLQPALVALLYLFPAIALAVLLVRFWRKWKDHLLGGDDALIAVAWILTLGNSIIVHLYSVAMYTGYHAKDVPFKSIDMVYAAKLRYALGLEYNPCVCVVKASFLWSLYKLRSHNPWIKRAIVALQVINAVYMVSATVIGAVPCLPVKKAWNPHLPGSCYDPYLYVIGNISVVIITDFLVLLIPTWIIWDLQMPIKRKIITIAFLSLGFIVIAIGIARLLWLLGAFKGKSSSYSVESAYSAIESSVAIIGACGPTIKYILSRFIPYLRPSFERSSSKKSSGNAYGYGNQSNVNSSRRVRSQYNTGNTGYDDLDRISATNEDYEMKNDWRWQQGAVGRDDDAKSDEQIISDPNQGIMKSVEWTVDRGAVAGESAQDSPRASRPAASPAHIV
ncbi:uncharacterized protein K460DRAFT_367295 [Cucurbitaria berberidis CBS 394.84]|uniref:Rhodopsin domain-containing protein n=1 Tax=Cucurbitaria berberidis CBS 394.84 TaxID=1168544 RepID=A0A9P4GJ14_9PLEO|nr:uncharacterized protein K460DRAFT_367295 [Cucurbitaria berberidis CBS 394.84]KAF1846542.1 hypothetical protein K460DRAFT_367295 [Cucurbitaria berberidis CBS 394.84]